MFEGGLNEFKAFIIKEFEWNSDGRYFGFPWEFWLPNLRPQNPACYLDELETTFGNDLKNRLFYATEQGSSRTDALRAALERFNSDSNLRRAFVESVRDDVGKVILSKQPTLDMIRAFDVAGFDLHQFGLLHLASAGNYADAVPYLIKRGFDIDGLNGDGDTPLHIAAGCQNKDCITALVDAGADTTKVDDDGRTAADIFPFVNDALVKRKAMEEAANLVEKHIPPGGRADRGGAL